MITDQILTNRPRFVDTDIPQPDLEPQWKQCCDAQKCLHLLEFATRDDMQANVNISGSDLIALAQGGGGAPQSNSLTNWLLGALLLVALALAGMIVRTTETRLASLEGRNDRIAALEAHAVSQDTNLMRIEGKLDQILVARK